MIVRLILSACLLGTFFEKTYAQQITISGLRDEITQNPECPKNLESIKSITGNNYCDRATFYTTVTQFVNFHDIYLNNLDWAGQKALLSKNLLENNFFMYIQKIIIKPESEIVFFGDLHGSIHSLVRSLEHLIDRGYLDNNFTIIKDNFYIVFLGDYVDRGNYGVEVLSTLFTLKLVNPDNVFVIRGNHENMKAHQNWGFHAELKHKFNDISQDLASLLQRAYMRMPAALFIGMPTDQIDQVNKKKIKYILCCHGGPDFGFNPNGLLQTKSSHAACIFDMSNQQIVVQKYYKQKNKSITRFASKQLIKSKVQETILLKNIGFLWNDFDNTGRDTDVVVGRAWKLGQDFTKYLLSLWSGQNYTVSMIIRGHQHDSSMYTDLVKSKGCYALWNYQVLTLFSAPAALHTVADLRSGQKNCFSTPFNYDSFVSIHMGNMKNMGKSDGDFAINHHWASCDPTKNIFESVESVWHEEKVTLF